MIYEKNLKQNSRDIVPVRGNQQTILVLKIININRVVHGSQEKYYREASFKVVKSGVLARLSCLTPS
jgi:hypothetical protein